MQSHEKVHIFKGLRESHIGLLLGKHLKSAQEGLHGISV
jgi:hypothetical protein